jgi:hypothetical protein
MGPNEGKSLFEQMRCVARALMAHSVEALEKGIASEGKDREYINKYYIEYNKLPQNYWLRYIYSDHDWFVYIEDPVIGTGTSTPNLPDGAQIAATFDLQSFEKKISAAFEKGVAYLESGFIPDSFLNLAHETMNSLILSNEMTAFAMGVDNFFKEQIQDLKKTVEACKPEYYINKIGEFRNWLRKFPDTTIPEKPNLLIVNDPNRLRAFVGHLQEERRRYCVDGLLYGSIQTIFDICGLCATEAQKKSSDNTTFSKVFSNLALFLTINKKKEPLQLLNGTVQKAINTGFINELIMIVKKYQSIVSGRIKKARLSKTLDQSLDHLYFAIPFAFGANTVLNILRHNADRLNEDTKLLVKGSYKMMNEQYTRLVALPFVKQILDFEGAEWQGRKALIAVIKRTRGEKAAETYVKDMVRRHLVFPEIFIPILLDQNNQNG